MWKYGCFLKFFAKKCFNAFISTDVSPASIKSCDLRASCSSECPDSTQKTVNPSSVATVRCSIMNEGSIHDLTWEQVRRKIHGSNNIYDLVLQQQQNPHCSCTHVTFARKYNFLIVAWRQDPCLTAAIYDSSGKGGISLIWGWNTSTPMTSLIFVFISCIKWKESPDVWFPEGGISAGIKCEYILFPSGPVQRVFKPSSPVWFNEKIQLNCTFKGWPRPTVVWINPRNKKIINGSDGFEIFEELIGDDTLSSVLSNLHMQEKHDGDYWCTAENSFDGWSSKLSKVTELIYECK